MRVAPLLAALASAAACARALPASGPAAGPAAPGAPAGKPHGPAGAHQPAGPHPGAPAGPGKKTGKTPADYAVSSKVPGIPFDLGPSYAGYVPIGAASKKRDLFFWQFPASEGVGHDDLVIWLNGGPGCSSMEGLLQENGPALFPWNSTDVVKNPWSWTKLGNVMWVDQPVGTGFARGDRTAANQEDVAADFAAFLVNYFSVFQNMKGKKLWLTGESYAGKYIPYMANYIYKHPALKRQGINLQGIAINDPSWAADLALEELPAYDFAKRNRDVLHLDDAFFATLEPKLEAARIKTFLEDNLKYPPRGPIYAPKTYDMNVFSPWSDVYEAAYDKNNCFNVYDVSKAFSSCPSVTDPLGFPPDANAPNPRNIFNDIAGLKEAIHVDPSHVWLECSADGSPVFPHGDASPAPIESGLMRRVIENAPSGRTLVQHGMRDFILLAQGSALAIQNMTWHGKQGFQRKPTRALLTVNGTNAGTVHTERGLTFAQITNSGHMVPQDDPPVAYKLLKYLLGQIPERALSEHINF